MSDHRVDIHIHGLENIGAAPEMFRLLREILRALTSMETKMSQMDDDITALQASVTAENTVIESAVSLINGFSAQIAAAVAAALAAGATPAQLQAVTDLKTAVDAKQAELAAAVQANTNQGPVPPAP